MRGGLGTAKSLFCHILLSGARGNWAGRQWLTEKQHQQISRGKQPPEGPSGYPAIRFPTVQSPKNTPTWGAGLVKTMKGGRTPN